MATMHTRCIGFAFLVCSLLLLPPTARAAAPFAESFGDHMVHMRALDIILSTVESDLCVRARWLV